MLHFGGIFMFQLYSKVFIKTGKRLWAGIDTIRIRWSQNYIYSRAVNNEWENRLPTLDFSSHDTVFRESYVIGRRDHYENRSASHSGWLMAWQGRLQVPGGGVCSPPFCGLHCFNCLLSVICSYQILLFIRQSRISLLNLFTLLGTCRSCKKLHGSDVWWEVV